jgi:hypothetical protein
MIYIDFCMTTNRVSPKNAYCNDKIGPLSIKPFSEYFFMVYHKTLLLNDKIGPLSIKPFFILFRVNLKTINQ